MSEFEDTRPFRSPRFPSALSLPLLLYVVVMLAWGIGAWLWRVWPWS